MTKSSLRTAAWISLAAGAFALGWTLKPAQDSARDEAAGSSGPSAITLSSSSRISGYHSATAAGAQGFSASGKPGAAGPLTTAGIAALGEEFRSARDPLARREAFAKLLAGLTVENALEVRKQIEHLDSDSPEFRDFHFAWGKIGGAEAVLHGAGTDKQDMGPTMAGWASANPSAARAWYEALPEKSEKPPRRDQMKEAIVHGLAIADPAKAVEFVTALGAAGDSRARQMMGIVTNKMLESAGPAAAAAWAVNLPEGELRGNALFDVARAQVRADPAKAAAWAAPLAGDKNGSSVIYGISTEWGGRNGAAAVKWLDTLSGNQSASYGPAVAGWAKADPLAASKYISTMPPSENRDYAIGGLVYSHRWEDPAATIAWAGEIKDTKRRQEVLTLAAEAFARKDPAGAAAWLPASGLPPATQQRLLSAKR
jgi:hypothetical protein